MFSRLAEHLRRQLLALACNERHPDAISAMAVHVILNLIQFRIPIPYSLFPVPYSLFPNPAAIGEILSVTPHIGTTAAADSCLPSEIVSQRSKSRLATAADSYNPIG